MIQQSHSWAYVQRKHGSKGYMYPNVHCHAFTTARTEKHLVVH